MYTRIATLISFLTTIHAGKLYTSSIGLDYYKGYRGVGNENGNKWIEGRLNENIENLQGPTNNYKNLEYEDNVLNNKQYENFGVRGVSQTGYNNGFGWLGNGLNQGYENIGLQGGFNEGYEGIELGNSLSNNKEYDGGWISKNVYEGGITDVNSSPKYEFEYGVNDPQTGDHKEHREKRVGDVTTSDYKLEEKDRNIQVSRVIAGKFPVKY